MSTPADFPPGASPVATRLAKRLIRPFEQFVQIEAASGVVLLAAGALALIWANSPWGASYQEVWATELRVSLGSWSVGASLQFIVNDILMAIFFFVVGLEIRREIHDGELSDLRRAALPVVAALGGMVVPAVIYTLISGGGDAGRGWGVPMATDIAFALGILALLGSRVPSSLRVLLLALAIIDDIGAIVVIAIFYSSGLGLAGFGIAAAGIVGIVVLQRLGVRHLVAYAVPSIVIWLGVLDAGVHPTIAGVIVGMLTPTRAWFGKDRFVDVAHRETRAIADTIEDQSTGTHALVEPMANLRRAQRELLSPVERIISTLHPWVAFVVMPLFALANAGVVLGGIDLGAAPGVAIGIAVALVAGKLIGVVLASALIVRTGIARLPDGVTWSGIVVVGSVAGIGFTMALFIADLAFAARDDLHDLAKVGVLGASAMAAIVTLIVGRRFLRPPVASS